MTLEINPDISFSYVIYVICLCLFFNLWDHVLLPLCSPLLLPHPPIFSSFISLKFMAYFFSCYYVYIYIYILIPKYNLLSLYKDSHICISRAYHLVLDIQLVYPSLEKALPFWILFHFGQSLFRAEVFWDFHHPLWHIYWCCHCVSVAEHTLLSIDLHMRAHVFSQIPFSWCVHPCHYNTEEERKLTLEQNVLRTKSLYMSQDKIKRG